MPLDVMDLPTLRAYLKANYPELNAVGTPPLPDSGRCGVCGELVPDPATARQGVYVVPPTEDVALAILLCPAHADRSDSESR